MPGSPTFLPASPISQLATLSSYYHSQPQPDVAAISTVISLALAARDLHESEEVLRDLAADMELEDGCITILGLDDVDQTKRSAKPVELGTTVPCSRCTGIER